MERIRKVLLGVTNKGVLLAIGLLIGIVMLVVANIVLRSLGGSIAPTYEITSLMIAVVIAFALVYTMLKKGHVVVEALVSRFPQRIQAILKSFTSLIGLGIWTAITWAILEITCQRGLEEVTAVLDFPYLPVRCLVVFALILLCLVLLVDLLEAIRQAVSK